MSDDYIEKTKQFLQKELDQLKPELANKIKERDKVRETFSKPPFVPFWKKPFKPLLEKRLRRKLRELKREIPALEEKIEHYDAVLVHLEQGIYSSVIPLLKQLLFDVSLRGIMGTKYREISELIGRFRALNS